MIYWATDLEQIGLGFLGGEACNAGIALQVDKKTECFKLVFLIVK